jgi:preprotein translocase subunit SecA
MTGTAWSEALFFLQTYKMKTIRIPTALPVARKDYPDVIFKTVAGKLKYVLIPVASSP